MEIDLSAIINILFVVLGIGSFVFLKEKARRAEGKLIDMEVERRRKEIRDQVIKYNEDISKGREDYEKSKAKTLDLIKRMDDGNKPG